MRVVRAVDRDTVGTVEAGEWQLRRIIFSSRDFHHPVLDKAGDAEVAGSIYRQAERGTVPAGKSERVCELLSARLGQFAVDSRLRGPPNSVVGVSLDDGRLGRWRSSEGIRRDSVSEELPENR